MKKILCLMSMSVLIFFVAQSVHAQTLNFKSVRLIDTTPNGNPIDSLAGDWSVQGTLSINLQTGMWTENQQVCVQSNCVSRVLNRPFVANGSTVVLAGGNQISYFWMPNNILVLVWHFKEGTSETDIWVPVSVTADIGSNETIGLSRDDGVSEVESMNSLLLAEEEREE